MSTNESIPSSAEIRTTLFQQFSKAQQLMNKQSIGEVALQILRFFVRDNHYAQARNFITNTIFPTADQIDSLTFQYTLYYISLVKAVFLEYDEALGLLNVLVRASHEDITEFHIHVYRLYVVVSLLTGTIPDRNLFSLPLVVNNMQPVYLELTQAVRRGEVDVYNQIVEKQENIDHFVADNMFNLILRLPATIVRTGLKRIICVYSAISLSSLGSLLSIPDDDVHSVVAKAIADGVIEATIDGDNIVRSKNNTPVYTSTNPQDILVKRINHTISLRQQCQQSLRYPDRQEEDEKTKGAAITARAQEDAVAPSADSDVFTAEERQQIAAQEETHEFQAEVNKLMDILINSIYTTRDIFLRETISNAADALDKLRFLSLTQPELLEAQPNMDIKVQFEPEKKIIRIIDTGIGMTKDELIKNLGVVAKSGTTDFLKAAQGGAGNDAVSLIGQFGVGFYSVYLVADRVTVRSKSPNDDQYVWESSAKSKYTIAKDPRGNTLGRGTEITLHLRPDSEEFLNDKRLTELVGKYSQFINFPIYVSTKKTITEEIEVPAVPKETTEDDVVVEENEETKPKTEKVTREVFEDVQVNNVKPLWTRTPSDITEEEYKEFYKSFTKDRTDYLAKNHFQAEGDITFKSVLFIPSKAEQGFYDRYYENPSNIKLFVKRVMISEELKDLTPRYLNFVRGLLDSDDLPLNVNREMLSQSKVVSVMSKKVIRKVLDMLKTLANDEKEEIENYVEQKKQEEENPDEVIDIKEPQRLYTTFWREFGKSIKLGILDDFANKTPLTRLLRFKSTQTKLDDENDWVSFDEYLERKKEGQDSIYFLTGDSYESLQTSPFLSRAKSLGIEVLLMTDPLDEYLVQSLQDYDGSKLQSLSREGVKLPGAEKPNLLKQQGDDFKDLVDFMVSVYNKAPEDKKNWSKPVEKVVVTHRLGNVPLAVVASQWGQSAGMERIMKSQALSNAQRGPSSRKTIEINPFHPVIKTLQVQMKEDVEKATDLAQLLFDSALITSGYGVYNEDQFAQRLMNIVARSLDVQDKEVDAEPSEDIEAPVVENAIDEAADAVNLDDANTIKIDPSDIKINYGGHDEL